MKEMKQAKENVREVDGGEDTRRREEKGNNRDGREGGQSKTVAGEINKRDKTTTI